MSAMMRPLAQTPDDRPAAILYTQDALRQFQLCLRHQTKAITSQQESIGMMLTIAASEYAHLAGHRHIEAGDVADACACMSRLFGDGDQAHTLHIAPGDGTRK